MRVPIRRFESLIHKAMLGPGTPPAAAGHSDGKKRYDLPVGGGTARSKVFPQLMIDLIRIGEDTGDVPGALENLAGTYENELSIQLRMLTNLIEPIMIITMAVGVGFLLFSVVSAMFSITQNLNR